MLFSRAGITALPKLRRILYLARLGDGHDYAVAVTLSREARLRSEALRVCGAWLFDGQRMCTMVFGSAQAVASWIDTVQNDLRQRVDTVLYDGLHDSEDNPGSWQVGYCEAEDLDAFDGGGVSGPQALVVFDQLMVRADLRP